MANYIKMISDFNNPYFSDNKILAGTEIPTSGIYKKGDIFVNIGDNADAPMWICVEAGEPGVWEAVGTGTGGGSLYCMQNQVLLSGTTDQVDIGIAGFEAGVDTLIVHVNGMLVVEGKEYNVIDGKIEKIEGNWNEGLVDDFTIDFTVFKSVETVNKNESSFGLCDLVCLKNNVTVTETTNQVEIGIEGFNKEKDMLTVYRNSTYMIEGVDYQISEDSRYINAIDGNWNENPCEGVFSFVVVKTVLKVSDDSIVENSNLAEGAVTMDKLAEDVQQAIEDASNIDLSGYQTNNSEELATTDKTIVGAINELFQNANNGKQIIADAIGSPLSSDDTFAAMGSSIDGLTVDFRNALAAKGVNAPVDKMESLIGRINEIVQSGNVLNNQCIVSGECTINLPKQITTADLTYNLDFTPDILIVEAPISTSHTKDTIYLTNIDTTVYSSMNSNYVYTANITVSNVTNTGCHLDITLQGMSGKAIYFNVSSIPADKTFKWWAIGSTQLPNNGGERTITPGISNQVLPEGYYSGPITVTGDPDLVAENIITGKEIFGVSGGIPNNGAKTITPGASNQTLGAGYYSGITVNGDPDLVAENIITGKEIFGVSGGIPNNGAKTITPGASNQTLGAGYYSGITVNGDADLKAANIAKGVNIFGITGTYSVAESTRTKLYNLMLEGGYKVTSGMDIDSMINLLELSGISLIDIKQISSGGYNTFILKHDGTLYGCGANGYGQLGLGDESDKSAFIKINVSGVKKVSAGYDHTFILKEDGTLWSTGRNYTCCLGTGDSNNKKSFTKITTNVSNVKDIVCGDGKTFMIKTDGTVWGCGSSYYGHLGIGNTSTAKTFTKLTSLSSISQVACGSFHTLFLKSDGTVYSCGSNEFGQLGLGSTDTSDHPTPTKITIATSVKQVACGEYHSVFLKTDGTVYTCGNNEYGQLGLGNWTNRSTFTKVSTNATNVSQIDCGYSHTAILKTDGTVYTCGNNTYGQLGLNNTNKYATFTKTSLSGISSLDCGTDQITVLKDTGDVYVCGYNSNGQLGLGTSSHVKAFTIIPRGL